MCFVVCCFRAGSIFVDLFCWYVVLNVQVPTRLTILYSSSIFWTYRSYPLFHVIIYHDTSSDTCTCTTPRRVLPVNSWHQNSWRQWWNKRDDRMTSDATWWCCKSLSTYCTCTRRPMIDDRLFSVCSSWSLINYVSANIEIDVMNLIRSSITRKHRTINIYSWPALVFFHEFCPCSQIINTVISFGEREPNTKKISLKYSREGCFLHPDGLYCIPLYNRDSHYLRV